MSLPDCLTVRALTDDYRAGSRRSSDVMAELLQRIERHADKTGIWISRPTTAEIMRRARLLDAELTDSPATVFKTKPLFGVPYAVKDNIDVAGMQTTAGCPDFAYLPNSSASVVQKLDEAGAILVGKCNLDQFATGLVGTRSPYGEGRNPFNQEFISGGSSSGSALATVHGFVAFALGTDTAGSGRVPAGFCNLVGLKPTPGLVANRGVFPACRTLDCVSVFAHTVADAWNVLTVLADAKDSYIKAPSQLGPLSRNVRIGIPEVLEFHGDLAAHQAFDESLIALQTAQVGSLTSIDLTPFDEVASLLYGGPWIAERRAAIGDFFNSHADAIDPIVHQIIAAADDKSAVDAFAGQYRLAELRQICGEILKQVDVVVVPTSPTIFRHQDIVQDPINLNNRLGKYTNFVNLLGLAALAVPGRFRKDGLPAGITLIGPGGSDHRLAELGRRIEILLHKRLGTTQNVPPRCQQPLPALHMADPVVDVAVVGAHLSGLPLNWQLVERGGYLKEVTKTTADYRLYALPGTVPPKPGLIRVAAGGAPIEVEVWEVPLREFGGFVADVPRPLSIGTLSLSSNRQAKGFICEAAACEGAVDITKFGGWRAYLASHEVASSA